MSEIIAVVQDELAGREELPRQHHWAGVHRELAAQLGSPALGLYVLYAVARV